MANEAVIIELLGAVKGRPVRWSVLDATAIPKGTLCSINGGRRCDPTAGDEYFVGIAAHEKVANDGNTTVSLYTHGIFDLKDAGSGITAGDACDVKAANQIETSDASGNLKSGRIIALETAAANEVIACLVGSGF